MTQQPFNPMPDGTCRTIKANYQRQSRANFLRGGYGATAVAVVQDCGPDMAVEAELGGGISNTLTSVAKDNYVVEIYEEASD